MEDANCTRSFPHNVRSRQPSDADLGLWVWEGIRKSTCRYAAFDYNGARHVRFVIALSGCSLSKYDNLGCAVRMVLEYNSDKRRLMLTEHQTLSWRSSHIHMDG